MPAITWKQLQYEKELQLYNKLRPILEHLRNKHSEFVTRTQQLEREFFNHLSHSVRIDKLDGVDRLLGRVNNILGIDTKINLFLFQHPVPRALCIPRYDHRGADDYHELVILVTQHFLNELGAEEQISVLGHELGHLLFGHVHIPAKAILESTFALSDIKELKSDVLKWMTCTELSCDMIGLACCGCNRKAFSHAMLKYVTGLADQIIGAVDGQHSLLELFLGQFEEISALPFKSALSTHPLTPLRLKIANAVRTTHLLANFGQSVSEKDLVSYKQEFNQTIDEHICKVYPEITSQKPLRDRDIRFELCVAVALADGRITKDEVTAIGRILGSSEIATNFPAIISQRTRLGPFTAARSHIETAVRQTTAKGCAKSDIVSIIRSALVVAASDGRIENAELDLIHEYSKPFGISKPEIAVLIGQMFS